MLTRQAFTHQSVLTLGCELALPQRDTRAKRDIKN